MWSKVRKEGFQLIEILGLSGMHFDAVIVEVKKNLLLFHKSKYSVHKKIMFILHTA